MRRLNAAVSGAGGAARFYSDNGFVAGPPELVWPAIEAYTRDLEAL